MTENERKLIELNKKLNEIEEKIAKENFFKKLQRKLALDFNEQCLIASIKCEINLRRILRRYYVGMEITRDDIDSISLYQRFSPLKTVPDLNEFDLLNLAVAGSGDFTDEETTILNTILADYNLTNKPKTYLYD